MNEIPPIPTVDYYLAINGERHGPFTTNQIEQKIVNGEINVKTLIWKKGLKQWTQIGEMDDFKHMFEDEGDCPPPIPTE